MTVHDCFESFELTPADYSFPMFYAGGALSFRLSNTERGLVALRDAISRLVCHLPFLTGFVVPSTSKLGTMEVHPPAEGEPKPDICIIQRFPHLRIPVRGSLSQQSVDMYDRNSALTLVPVHIAASPTEKPVMRFQINLLDNGIILAVFVNHMVIDGTGVGTLLQSLAACCNDAPCLPASMECELTTRETLLATLKRDHSSESSAPVGAGLPAMQATTETSHEDVHDPSLLDCNFSISAAKLAQLRGLIQNIDPGFMSDDDILTAILWMCLGRLRSHPLPGGGPDESACTLERMVNVRHRWSPRVPSHYLGNCFVVLNQTLNTAELEHEGPSKEGFARQIASVARALRDNLNTVDDRFVRNHLSQFTTADSWANTLVHQPDVAVTSIRQLSVYEEDFGPVLGKAVDFELLPYMNPEGVCTIKPRRGADDDAWEVCITLERQEMDCLRKDVMWRWLVDQASPLLVFEANTQ